MNKSILIYFLLSIPFLGFCQTKKQAKLSPLTQIFLANQAKTNRLIVPNYVYKTIAGNQTFVSALIKVESTNTTLAEQQIKMIGGKIGTKAGSIWTVQIPVEKVKDFSKLENINYIELNEPTIPCLDSARRTTHVDSVHKGIGLPTVFNGDGVVVGIIDAGFDFGSPSLFDTTGVGYRVKKVWQQHKSGIAPTGFGYGSELTDSIALWADGTDLDQTTHGTHVCGIAAGSGFGSSANNARYRGVAYKSDIVLVGITPTKSQWVSTGVSDMIDGLNYVYQYANSKSKPAIANLSWGNPVGPHDGSSLVCQAYDNLTGSGNLFALSAGNSGGDNIHIKKTFTATDTSVKSYLNIYESPIGKLTWIDIWGDTGKTFCIKLRLYNTGTFSDSTIQYCIDDSLRSLQLIGSTGDTCFVNMVTVSNEYNNKPHIFLDIDSRVPDYLQIELTSNDGTINMWDGFVSETSGYYSTFSNAGGDGVAGDKNQTISDMSTAKSVITVGAYASKNIFTNISGQQLSYTGYVSRGALVPFSSRGPTADGRSKPDITGPGLTLGSSISSYDTSFLSTGSSYDNVILNYHNPQNNRDYPYACLMGTSMSSPMVSGIIALLLQINPTLNPIEIKDLLSTTAIKDNYTTQNPAPNNWGAGKVNAYKAVINVIASTTATTHQIGNLVCQVYPNPANDYLKIDFDNNKNAAYTYQLIDLNGATILTNTVQSNSHTVDIRNIANGLYVIIINQGNNYFVQKVNIAH